MKISTRFSLRKILSFFFLFFILTFSLNLFAQNISPTDGVSPCSTCAPTGWVVTTGTPDVSSSTQAAAPPLTGGGATWNVPGNVLPLPPNSHLNWISLRDLGPAFTEEIVTTTMTGLTAGRDYEVVLYTLSATTLNDGNNGDYYAGTYIDLFRYRVGANPIQIINTITQDAWSTTRFRFTATGTSETLQLLPGQNGAGQPRVNYETIQISISLNAINTAPVADDNSDTTTLNTPVTFNVTGTDIDYDGNIVDSTVDLDVSTSGIQNNISNAQGTWSADVNGDVTFTPVNGFVGVATLDYTVEDDYVLDGNPTPATSNQATLTVTVLACSIDSIVSSNESVCNDNTTPADITDDTFTADITVNFTNAPGTGTLDLSGDGTASVSVVGLTSPHTFNGVVLPANGETLSVTATFSDGVSCTLTNSNLVNAPYECSDDDCADVIPPGSPVAPIDAIDVTFNITNPGANTDPKTFNSISIAGEPNPFTNLLVPDNISYSYNSPSATNQRIIENGVDGATILDGPAIFDPALIDANTDRNLNHYYRTDGNIFPTDYVNFEFNYDINSASNRYVIITERGGNNTMEVQAIDGTGNVIGTPRPIYQVSGADGPTTYIGMGVNNDNGQEVHATIYPLTAFVGPNVPIHGVRLTQTGASPSGGDGGDGKVFIVYDPFFLTPPPTISLSSTFTQPVCPANEGSITINATDNGGGTIEYSINGAAGPWQTSNVFNNVSPGNYNIAARYVSAPLCLNVSPNTFALVDAGCITCDITDISASNLDPCNDNGTPTDLADDTFTADITVTFTGAPASGTLDLTGDGTASVSVVGLTSPHTFVDVVFQADGGAVDLTATFSDVSCTLNNSNVFTALYECSDDTCSDVIPIGSPTAPLVSGDVTFNITGTGGVAGALLNSITVAGEPNPFTEVYVPSTVEYQFGIPAQTNQYMYDMGVLGSNINDNPAIFDAELLESYSNKELTNYFSADNGVAPGITTADFVLIRYDAPITAAANRYMVATERDGNISYRIQALDAAGNPIGTERTTSVATYIDTGVQADPTNFPGENIAASIYPLTAFVPSGDDIYGFRIRFRNSSNGDGGDGKVFVLYDSAFLTPPPTIEATTSAVQPTCPTNLGSITIDATDNGGGTIEYSINGAVGPWQTSNIFNNLVPGTYTPAVRYQSTPDCLAVSINPITLEDSGFNITAITASDITACNDNSTPSDITDDTFTADITITFDGTPATGTLDLTGDGTATVSVVGLTSPHTFNNVAFSASGNDISLTAAFSDASTCSITDAAVFTAPTECSDDGCDDAIPSGNPTAPLASADVTFDITGTGGVSGAVLNSITVAGEPNPFTDFYVPSTVSYSFANPAATNQYLYDMGTLGSNITDGPTVFDPELLDAYRDRDLTNYLSTDNNIDPVDFVDIKYDAPITAAANRYMVASERNGNNSYRVQALDAAGNPIGTLVVTSTGTYIDTGIEVDAVNYSGQNIEISIYPLTAFVPAGNDIYGFRIRFRNSSSGDGGDGKVFVMYDPTFLTPPPTIELTTSAIQPTCPTNEGSITIDATDNGGGTIEYSVNGAVGPWQTSNVFNNLVPGTYTPAVRYQSTPDCLAVSNNPITLNNVDCPSIEAVKTVAITNDVAPVGASLGDTVEYTITVTNTGNVTLDN
ncbi:Ig-like domain-containing protein, partial [Winogradskyella pulchriflava]